MWYFKGDSMETIFVNELVKSLHYWSDAYYHNRIKTGSPRNNSSNELIWGHI